jgi:hypothetical protein
VEDVSKDKIIDKQAVWKGACYLKHIFLDKAIQTHACCVRAIVL